MELLDGDGGLTRLERRVSGKVTSATPRPPGAVTGIALQIWTGSFLSKDRLRHDTLTHNTTHRNS